MADLDLTEAIEAAKAANDGNVRLMMLTPSLKHHAFEVALPGIADTLARRAVSAAKPVIEAQVRAQIAADIEAQTVLWETGSDEAWSRDVIVAWVRGDS